MIKKSSVALVIALALVVGIVVGHAVQNMWSAHQILTVPERLDIKVYRTDFGYTDQVLTNGDNLTGLWTWNGLVYQLSLNITNKSNKPVAVTFSPSTLLGWAFTYVGNETSLVQNESRIFSITATPPNLTAGTSTGDFSVSVYFN